MSKSATDILNNIDSYANVLKFNGLTQLAADLSYLVAWFKSKDWNNQLKLNKSDHLPPHPAGKDTVGQHEIPSAPISDYTDSGMSAVLSAVSDELNELLLQCTNSLENKAVTAFLDYISVYNTSA